MTNELRLKRWRNGLWGAALLTVLACAGGSSDPPRPDYTYLLAFVSDRDGNPQIYTYHTLKHETRRITFDAAEDTDPAWRYDKKYLAFSSSRTGDAEIYRVRYDTAELQQLTNSPAADVAPCWNWNGTKIAFQSDRSGSNQIWVMDFDGSNPHQVTTAGGRHPAWITTEQGEFIAFVATTAAFRSNLFTMHEDGTGLTNLTNHLEGDDRSPYSDGLNITYSYSADGGGQTLRSMTAVGSNDREVFSIPGLLADHPTGGYYFAATPDGTPASLEIYVHYSSSSFIKITDNAFSDSKPAF